MNNHNYSLFYTIIHDGMIIVAQIYTTGYENSKFTLKLSCHQAHYPWHFPQYLRLGFKSTQWLSKIGLSDCTKPCSHATRVSFEMRPLVRCKDWISNTIFSKLNRQFRQILHKGFNESSLPLRVNVSANSTLRTRFFDFKPLCCVSLCGARRIRISIAKALWGLIYERGRGLVPGFFCNVPAIHAPDLRHFCV